MQFIPRREMVTQVYTATLVAATLTISRSSLYYQNKPRGVRADRTYDEQIVLACGEKPAYEEARAGITAWINEYNHDRPHRGVGNRTPHEAFSAFAVDLNSESLNV